MTVLSIDEQYENYCKTNENPMKFDDWVREQIIKIEQNRKSN